MLHITPLDRLALQLLADDVAAAEMAARLNIREQEIDGYVCALCLRLGASTRHGAIVEARRRGLLEPSTSDRTRHVS